jgi:hypothetical protein
MPIQFSNSRTVIPGWSQRVGALRRPMTGSGPDLRCAIAHRGISRFRVRCSASPRNDSVCSKHHVVCSKHHVAISRRDAPELYIIFRPLEGVGNAGCPLHPRPRVHLVVVERTPVTTSTPESPGIPARNGFNGLCRALVTGLFCHRRLRICFV